VDPFGGDVLAIPFPRPALPITLPSITLPAWLLAPVPPPLWVGTIVVGAGVVIYLWWQKNYWEKIYQRELERGRQLDAQLRPIQEQLRIEEAKIQDAVRRLARALAKAHVKEKCKRIARRLTEEGCRCYCKRRQGKGAYFKGVLPKRQCFAMGCYCGGTVDPDEGEEGVSSHR
jgi:hypothetical protein